MIWGFSCIQQERGIGSVSSICRLGKEAFCFLPPAWGSGVLAPILVTVRMLPRVLGRQVLLSFWVSLFPLEWAVHILYSTGVLSDLPLWGQCVVCMHVFRFL